MSNDEMRQFPANWRIASDFDPNEHLMSLKGRDYLNVQNRLLWFIKDQRDFIVRGLATTSYCIRSEAVEVDTTAGYAHFKTYVRDVLGNEATMYGSEQAKDFADYAEKASTKSLGRALLALGYGTAFAPEMDEGERVVDAPVERRKSAQPAAPRQPESQSEPPVTTPAASTTPQDALATTVASELEQKRLVGKLEAYNLLANGGFLKNATGRDIDIGRLRAGTSDLTLKELAIISQRLTRMPAPAAANGKAARP